MKHHRGTSFTRRSYIAIPLLLLLSLAALISGCGGSSGGSTAAATEEGTATSGAGEDGPSVSEVEKATGDVTLWVNGESEYKECTEESLAEIEADNPEIHVSLQMQNWENYQEKLLTGVAGGSPPDIVMGYSDDLAPWASRGLLLNLEPYIKKANYVPGMISATTYEGDVYALPWGFSPRVLAYQKNILKEAGITSAPRTWPEFTQDAQTLTTHSGERIERSGFFIPLSGHQSYETFYSFLKAAGGSIFNSSGTEATFNGPQGVEALSYLDELMNKYHVDAPNSIPPNVEPEQYFAENRIGFLGTNSAPALAAEFGLKVSDVELIAFPAPPGHEPWSEFSGHILGVTQKAANPAAAVKVLLGLTSTTNGAVSHSACAENLLPGYKPALESTKYGTSNPWIQRYKALISESEGFEPNPEFNEIATFVETAIQQVLVEHRSAQEALDEAAENADSALSSGA